MLEHELDKIHDFQKAKVCSKLHSHDWPYYDTYHHPTLPFLYSSPRHASSCHTELLAF
jgi:hypothetical protein